MKNRPTEIELQCQSALNVDPPKAKKKKSISSFELESSNQVSRVLFCGENGPH